MPPAKKQKTAGDAGVSVESNSKDPANESSHPHKNDKNKKSSKPGDPKDPAPHDYICFHRPLFDVESANWLAPDSLEGNELVKQVYKPGFAQEEKDNVYKAAPSEHKDHKWVIMWEAWLKTDILGRKARYCNPDNFGMYLCNDWQGWGMQEIGENVMIEYDKAFHSKGNKRLEDLWVVVSAVGLWLNEDEHIGLLINNEDGSTTCKLIGLIGCALLSTLAATEAAGELKPDSRFLDLTLVISYYFEISHDLPDYGIEGECVAWRREAVKYFKKGKLDPEKGLSATKVRMEKLEKAGDYDGDDEDADAETVDEPVAEGQNANQEAAGEKAVSPPSKGKAKRASGGVQSDEKDPWKWADKFKAYKKGRGSSMGGQKYDITKMSRTDRAAAAFDGKDPLAGVPVKELKEDMVDLV
ncbi:hypothetical protein BDW02DRAFT_568937 [Decorospora gaudefroyi]|uniref:Uncharacterized protein n=1 Tax=Decorospora gaudefroyi TaxID=184978 RepID=A0A6A5KE25_9PLEO|nr:hypothetical protein BDW02DRAFT_568937 [Decorospora gaudefroyi]